MPCETGLAECLVHIRADDGTCGSGLLLAPDLVLTCAHVVSPGFYKDDEYRLTPRTTAEACCVLATRIGDLSVDVRTYDGRVTRARLVKVHDELDMVLLELAEAVPIAPVSPPLRRTERLQQANAVLSLGLLDYGASLRLHCASITPSGNEDPLSGAVSAFSGQAEAGMSGGPVFRRTAEGFELIAITSFGGGEADYTVTIRDDMIRSFVQGWALKIGRSEPDICAAGGFGLPGVIRLPLLADGPDIAFVRCLSPKTHLRAGANAEVVYLAAHVLSLWDVDALCGRTRTHVMREARARSLAAFSQDELSELEALLMTGPEPWRAWLRPASVTELAQPLARLAPADPPDHPQERPPASPAFPDLPLSRSAEERFGDLYFAPPEDGHEWASAEDGTWQQTVRRGREIEPRRRLMSFTGPGPCAAFRPALAIPVWHGAVR